MNFLNRIFLIICVPLALSSCVESTALNPEEIENIALIDDYSYPKIEEVEKEKDESEKSTHLLKKINMLDKAFDKAVNLFKSKI